MSECKFHELLDGRVLVECSRGSIFEEVIKAKDEEIRNLKARAYRNQCKEGDFKGQLKGFDVRYGDEPQRCTLILDGTLESEIVFTVDKVLAGFLVEKLSDFVNPVQDESLQTQISSLRIEVETLRASLNRLTR